MQEKFIGDKKILSVSLTSEKTPIGSEIVKVLFEDGTSKLLPKALADRIQTDTPIDATVLRKKWVDVVVNNTIILLQENDIKMEDMDYFMNTLLISIEDKCNRANAALYGVEYYPQRSLLSVERIINPFNNNDQADNK